MFRAFFGLIALFTIGCFAVVGYSCATPSPAARQELHDKSSMAARNGSNSTAEPESSSQLPAAQPKMDAAAGSETSPPPAPSQEIVARWIAAATGEDSQQRAAAITALAEAPQTQAVPVLSGVLTSGDPQVDRPLALRSLRTLALRQGDADGSIRTVLRQAIYHADEESLASGAQAVLDDIEHQPEAAPHSNP